MTSRSVDYNQLEKEKIRLIQKNISNRLAHQTLGKIDSLRHTILQSIVNSDYERALFDLDRFMLSKEKYPTFSIRTRALKQHAEELVGAIEAKRNLPGLSTLNVSRQQEMLDSVIAHFDELKNTLRQIERIAKDCALEDLRSTAWVLRTMSYVAIAIVSAYFITDFHLSLGRTFVVVYNDFTDQLWRLVETLI